MTTGPAYPIDAMWTTATATLAKGVPLPTMRAAGDDHGFQELSTTLATELQDYSTTVAWLELVLLGWSILASRYLDTDFVTVGHIDGDGVNHAKVYLQLVPIEPNQSVQSAYAWLQANRNSNLELPAIVELCGLNPNSNLTHTLIAVNWHPMPTDPDTLASPWVATMTKHDCSLLVVLKADPSAFTIQAVFDQHVYPRVVIEQLTQQLSTITNALLVALCTSKPPESHMRIKDVPWVSTEEHALLLRLATADPIYPSNPERHRTIQGLFGQWVDRLPHQLAVIDGDRALTYRELSQCVNRLAHTLQAEHKVTREVRVAFLGRRSLEATVAIMAIVHAGGAFILIDSQAPTDRVAYMLEDSQTRLLLTTQQNLDCVPLGFLGRVVNIDGCCSMDTELPVAVLHTLVYPHNLVYIVYTSGTTGTPKGVLIEYLSLINLTTDPVMDTIFSPGARVWQFFSIGFDAYINDFFGTLLHGGTLVLMGSDPLESLKLVDIAPTTPSFWAKLNPKDFPNVKIVCFGGEPCPKSLIDRWGDQCRLHNFYGPSETTIVCQGTEHFKGKPVTIGKPLANVFSYVVDHLLQLVPMGVIGELLIGGVGVARGYCNLPELTAERFLPNPFGPGRVYRTGDLVRWLPDGNLEYIGRRDNQVKLNGFRIELEEVESVAGQCSRVQQAAVLVHRNHLVCFVTPELSDFAPLADHLRQKLPHYMVPHTLVALAQLPTTVNGKVDKRALADLDLDSAAHCSLVADSATLDLDTDTTLDTASDNAFADQEAVLRQAWAELLDVPVERIARQAHFFQLGGDSIVAILLVSKCRQQGYQLTVPTVYAHPVLASLARHLVPLHAATTNSAVCAQTPVTGAVPLTPIQQWFFGLPLQNPHHFNQSFLLKLNPRVDANAIQGALVTLLTHHDMLRCRYTLHDNQWHQTIPTAEATHADYCWAECHTTEAELSQHLAKLHTQLSLTQGPLLGALLIHLNDLPDLPRLYLVSHHIVIDLVSWRILIDDLNTLLSHQPLPPKTLSFAKWATSLDAHAATLTADCWPEQGTPTNATAPIPADQVGTRHSIFQTLDATITDQLVTHVCPALRVTPRDAILSAYALAYCQTLDTAQVNLCMEGHGREPWSPDLDISRTVGWFTSFYPLVIHTQSNASLADVLHQAKERLQQIPTKGFPYFLIKYMASANTDERSKLLAKTPAHLNVLFNYFGRFTQSTATDQSLVSIDWSDQYGEHDLPTKDWMPFDQYIMAIVGSDALRLGIDYNTQRCTDIDMRTLLKLWARHLHDLISSVTTQTASLVPIVTRFDFDMLSLSAIDFEQVTTQLTQRNLSWNDVEDIYPCTPLQSGLLLATQSNPHAYVVQCTLELHGNVDASRLTACWQRIAANHSILRTVFLESPSKTATGFVQVVLNYPVMYLSIDGSPLANRLVAGTSRPKPLDELSVAAHPLRLSISTNATQTSATMCITFHHALLDGWSMMLLVSQVLSLYHGVLITSLGSTKFKSVVSKVMPNSMSAAHQEFWQAYLNNALPTPAPLIHPRFSPDSGFSSHRVPLAISKTSLVAFARQHHVSLSTLLRAAYALFLARCLHTDDVVFGTIVSGRNLDLENVTSIIGPCINTVPFRVCLTNEPVTVWLQRLHHDYVQLIPHEQCSLVDITRWSETPIGTRLVNTIMGFENQPTVPQSAQVSIQIQNTTVEEYTEYPLSVTFEDKPDALWCKVLWARGKYDSHVGPDMVMFLAHILEQIQACHATTPVQSIQLLPVPRDYQPQVQTPAPWLGHSAEHNLGHLFKSFCVWYPGAVVRASGTDTYTWSDIWSITTIMCMSMYEHLVDRDAVVVAVVDSHLALALSVLAATRCRATLVPVSATHSLRSIEQLCDHVHPALTLVPEHLRPHLNQVSSGPQLTLDGFCKGQANIPPLHLLDEMDQYRRDSVPALWVVHNWDATEACLIETSADALDRAWAQPLFSATVGTRVTHSFPLDSESALWVMTSALSQGCVLDDGEGDPFSDTASTIHVTGPDDDLHAVDCSSTRVVRLVPLSTSAPRGRSGANHQEVAIQLYAISLFSGHLNLTADQYQSYAASGTLPSALPLTVVDPHGCPCPEGISGALGPLESHVRIRIACHGEYLLHPWWVSNGLPLGQLRAFGYRHRSGALCLTSVAEPWSIIDGTQIYPQMLHPILRQVSLDPVYIAVISGSGLIAVVRNPEFDLTLYSARLAKLLPESLLPYTVLSTVVFPHLGQLLNERHRLDAFAIAYHHVLRRQDQLVTEVRRWLATHWIALGYGACDPATALTRSLWELDGRLVDLVHFCHHINAKFGIALSIPDVLSQPHFSGLVALIDTALATKEAQLILAPPTPRYRFQGPILDECPVTAAQLRTWCLAQNDHSIDGWYCQQVYRLDGVIDKCNWHRAFTWLLSNCDRLRTTIVEKHGVLRQRTYAPPPNGIECPLVYIYRNSDLDEASLAGTLAQHHLSMQTHTWPWISLVVLMVGDPVHSTYASIRLHPLIGDQTALGALWHSFWRYYICLSNGLTLAAQCTSVQLGSLVAAARHEQQLSKDAQASAALAYWQTLIADVPPLEGLPADCSIGSNFSRRVQSFSHTLSNHAHLQMANASATKNVELYNVWLSLLGVYLSRITRQSDMLLGVQLARGLVKASSYLQSDSISLLFYSHHEPDSTLSEVLGQTQRQIEASVPHAIGSLEWLVHSLGLNHDALSDEVPNIVVAFRCKPAQYETLPTISPFAGAASGHMPGPALLLAIDLGEHSTEITAQYSQGRFSPELICNLLANLDYFAASVLLAPTQLYIAPLSRPEETRAILADFVQGPTFGNIGVDSTIGQGSGNFVQLIQATAIAQPALPALDYDGEITTYHAMVDQATTVALAMQAHGISHQSRVAVLVENHPTTVITMLALWQCSAVYVPIDAQLPMARQQYMIDTAECTLVIDARLMNTSWPQAIRFSQLTRPPPNRLATSRCSTYAPNDLIYIIFTSGTTGQPKGVPIPYRGLFNLVHQDPLHLCPAPGTRLLHAMGVGFDAYIFAAILGLCWRSTLVFNTGDLISIAQRADTALLTPSMLSVLDPQTHANLRSVATGGEALPTHLARPWVEHCPVYNGYGPSEITIISHASRVHSGQPVTIGRPIANTVCYILDPHRNVTPVGVVGEIYLGGPGVSPGYLNQPDLNPRRFIPNPFGDGTLYATGDLGRWLRNGDVECLGRIDSQVKIRGHRIELAEVTDAVLAQPKVTIAVVQVFRNQLVAFVGPAHIEATGILAALARQLPNYMVPSHILPIPAVPQTTNGKIDAKALEAKFVQYQNALQTQAQALVQALPPQTEALQRGVAQVIELTQAAVNLDLTFIQLGGDSISAIQLSAQLRQMGYALPIPAILQRTPLRTLAKTLIAGPAIAPTQSYPKPAPGATVPLTPIQHVFFGWAFQNPHHFTQSIVLELTRPISRKHLDSALRQLVHHHDILRSRFVQSAEGVWTHTWASLSCSLGSLVDTITCNTNSLHSQLLVVQRQLNLEAGQLLRSALIQVTETAQPTATTLLFLTVHHLVVDLVSWRMILEDLHLLLQNQPLAPVPLPFGAWACALKDWGSRWSTNTSDHRPVLSLPSIDPACLHLNTEGNRQTASFALATSLSLIFEQLESYSRRFGVRPTELVLAALVQTLHHLTGESTVTIWHENHGRYPWAEDLDLSHTIGWFTALYPVTLTVEGTWSQTNVLQRVKHAVRTLPHHGLAYGIQQMHHGPSAGLASYKPMGVVFNYLGKTTDQATLTMHGQAPWIVRPDLARGLPVCDADERRPQLLEILAYQHENDTRFDLQYCPQVISPVTIAALTTHLPQVLGDMLSNYAIDSGVLYWSPDDFPQLDLTWDDLNLLQGELKRCHIEPSDVEDVYPMLRTQQSLLAATQRNPSQYTVQTAMTVHGVTDSDRLRQAFRQVMAQNTILRTRFLMPRAQPSIPAVQVVLQSNNIEWQVANSWSSLNARDEDDYMQQNYARGFPIATPPLRCVVVPISDQALRLVVTMHHAIIDGWSFSLLLGELLQALQDPTAYASNGTHIGFGDYVRHIRQLDLAASREFWWRHLQCVQRPTILAPPQAPKRKAAMQAHMFPFIDDLSTFHRIAHAAGLTTNVILKAAWALLLYAHTQQPSVVFGHTMSGRNLDFERIDQLMGCLISTIPFCVQVDQAMRVQDLLHQVSQASLEMTAHGHCHLQDIEHWTRPETSSTPLFNTLLVYENYPKTDLASADHAITLSNVRFLEDSEHDLAILAEIDGNTLAAYATWNSSKFHKHHVDFLVRSWCALCIQLQDALDSGNCTCRIDELDTFASENNHWQLE
ncbi:hypothetical protein H4R34_000239 [Dimargaris verticillata]|uniref:Carrier domain-containing protein n=1 Tax=Dimargaris verticillata TaxID=2761393 RepID=A0A9W8EC15_9FUNG|nr:hypothetical protein H4R34_000239 [Dimargaris verticillata]